MSNGRIAYVSSNPITAWTTAAGREVKGANLSNRNGRAGVSQFEPRVITWYSVAGGMVKSVYLKWNGRIVRTPLQLGLVQLAEWSRVPTCQMDEPV